MVLTAKSMDAKRLRHYMVPYLWSIFILRSFETGIAYTIVGFKRMWTNKWKMSVIIIIQPYFLLDLCW